MPLPRYAVTADATPPARNSAPTTASRIQLALRKRGIKAPLSRGLLPDPGPHPPQVGEGPLGQRRLEVRDAVAAPGPPPGADHPLHHLHVMRAPEREALVHL